VRKKVRYFKRFISAGMMSLSLGILSGETAQAQFTTSLVDLTCVTTRAPYGDFAYRRYSQDISIGREIYKTVMWVNSNSSFTCKLPATRAASLRLKFGIQDNDKDAAPTIIKIYLDGKEVMSQTAYPGKIEAALIDISKGKSLAIETNFARTSNRKVALFLTEAQIEPKREFLRRRK
jgi:hypothetical protein